MKKTITFLLLFFSLMTSGQITFEKGYFINEDDQQINCWIKNLDWKNNPTQFKYKLSENSSVETLEIQSVKEFGINNISKYVRHLVNLDRSSEEMRFMSTKVQPIFKEELLFLKVIVEGKATLYQYIDQDLRRYFYNVDKSKVKQLIFKSYKTYENQVKKNNQFRQQLTLNLKCNNDSDKKISKARYSEKELANIFKNFNVCNNSESVSFKKDSKTKSFRINAKLGVHLSTVALEGFGSSRDVSFENVIGGSIGIEGEYILPFHKNKWAFFVEPTYKYLKEENVISGSVVSLDAKMVFHNIEIPVGIRHYFYLNQKSKVFINTSFIFNYSNRSKLFLSDNLHIYEYITRPSLGFGLGFNHLGKYNAEFRLNANPELLKGKPKNTRYQYMAVVFGYRIY